MFSFESYGVFETTSKWFRMTVEIFVRIVSTVFDKIKKSSQMAVPWSILASLESQPYDVDLIAHIGPHMVSNGWRKFHSSRYDSF